MTFYDDADFAAIKLARLALAETGHEAFSPAMHQVVLDMYERHGSDGVSALVLAMARQYAGALLIVADHRGLSVDEVVDEFERAKLQVATAAEDQDD